MSRNVRAARRQLPPEYHNAPLTEGRHTVTTIDNMPRFKPKRKSSPGGTAKSSSFYWGRAEGRKI